MRLSIIVNTKPALRPDTLPRRACSNFKLSPSSDRSFGTCPGPYVGLRGRRTLCIRHASAGGDDEGPLPEASGTGRSVALSQFGQRAGEVFVLAGFLKILIVCFPFSTMAISMYFQGLCDLGYWAAIKMFPLAIGMLALAKTIVDRKLHEKKFAPLVIVTGGICALLLSRWAFARPRPSPLDPMLSHYRRVQMQEAAAAQKREQERQAQKGKRRSLEPDERIQARMRKLQGR